MAVGIVSDKVVARLSPLSVFHDSKRIRFCSLVLTAKDVIKEIEDFDSLEALRLEGNTVGVEAAKVIAKALEKKSELKVRSSG